MGLHDEIRDRRRDGMNDSDIIKELVDEDAWTRDEVYDALDTVSLPSEDRVGSWYAHAWLGVFASILTLFGSIYLSPIETFVVLESIPGLAYGALIVVGFAVLSIWWGIMKLHDTVRSAALAGAGLVTVVAVVVPSFQVINYNIYAAGVLGLVSFFQLNAVIALGLTGSLSLCVGALYRDRFGRGWLVVPLVAILFIGGMFINDIDRYPAFETDDTDYQSFVVLSDQVENVANAWNVDEAVPPFSSVVYAGNVLRAAQQLGIATADANQPERFYTGGSTCGGFSISGNAVLNPALLLESVIEWTERNEANMIATVKETCQQQRSPCTADEDVASDELDQLLDPYRTIADHAQTFFGTTQAVDEFAVYSCSSSAAQQELGINGISCGDGLSVTLSSARDPITSSVDVTVYNMAGELVDDKSRRNVAELDGFTGQQTITTNASFETNKLYEIELTMPDSDVVFSPRIVCRGGDGFCEDCADKTDQGLEVQNLTCSRDGDQISTQLHVTHNGVFADGKSFRFDPTDYLVEQVYRNGEQLETINGTVEDSATRSFSEPGFGTDRQIMPGDGIYLNRTVTGDPGTYRFELERFTSVVDDPTVRPDQYRLNSFTATCTVE